MIFSDESGQNLTSIIHTLYDGRIMLSPDCILDFPKGPHILSISHLKYQSWISVYTFEFQNGHVMTLSADQLANKKVR